MLIVQAKERLNIALTSDGLQHWLSMIVRKVANMIPSDEHRMPNMELTISCTPIESTDRPERADDLKPELTAVKMATRPAKGPLKEAFDHMHKLGWQVSNRGWPEFFAYHPESKSVACIKVEKRKNRRLRKHQRLVLRALAAYGVPCYLFDPSEKLFVRLHIRSPQIREDRDDG